MTKAKAVGLFRRSHNRKVASAATFTVREIAFTGRDGGVTDPTSDKECSVTCEDEHFTSGESRLEHSALSQAGRVSMQLVPSSVKTFICLVCGNAFTARRPRGTCSKVCRLERFARRWAASREALLQRRACQKQIHATHQKVQTALRNGGLIRRSTCGRCGRIGNHHQVTGHHDDYSRPLDVQWLCSRCHRRRHLELALLALVFERVPSVQLPVLGEVT